MTKLLCKCCNSELGLITEEGLSFSNMKALSAIMINFRTGIKELKCHTCHNWLMVDVLNNVTINYKKKASDILYNQTNKK